MIQLNARHENWPLRDKFSISRGSRSSVDVVVVELNKSGTLAHGEAVPYARYEQTVEQTLDAISDIAEDIRNGMSRDDLIRALAPNAARNALDCALWDLEAKAGGTPVWKLGRLPKPKPVVGAYTVSMAPPEDMARSSLEVSHYPLLKLKLGESMALESVEAVRRACPETRLIVDANEAWTIQMLDDLMPRLVELGIETIEQPLPAGADEILESREYEIPLCADESFFDTDDLARLSNCYEIFNIKLDKTGGLTHAVRIAEQIRRRNKQIMVGSMMATSLSLAPAMLLTHDAAFVDLDSPLWLDADREGGIQYRDGLFEPAQRTLWG